MSCRPCQGWHEFLQIPIWALTGHDEAVRWYQVLIDKRAVSCHDETVQMASKKQGTSASAGSPIDFVSAAGLVKMPKVK